MLIWSQAGGIFHISPGGNWLADSPREEWPIPPEDISLIASSEEESAAAIVDWIEPYGDRRYLNKVFFK